MGDIVLYEIDEAGERRMLHGTPIEEREPEHGRTRCPASASAYGDGSGAGVLLTTTLYDDAGSLGFLDLSRPGELEPVDDRRASRTRASASSSGSTTSRATGTRSPTTSTAARGPTRELRRRRAASFTVERVLVGRGRARRRRSARDRTTTQESGRFVASFCTATSPTQLHVLPADDVGARDR